MVLGVSGMERLPACTEWRKQSIYTVGVINSGEPCTFAILHDGRDRWETLEVGTRYPEAWVARAASIVYLFESFPFGTIYRCWLLKEN